MCTRRFCIRKLIMGGVVLLQAGAFKKMQSGDFSEIVRKLLSPKVEIEAPVFFHNGGGPDSLISGGCMPLFLYSQGQECRIKVQI